MCVCVFGALKDRTAPNCQILINFQVRAERERKKSRNMCVLRIALNEIDHTSGRLARRRSIASCRTGTNVDPRASITILHTKCMLFGARNCIGFSSRPFGSDRFSALFFRFFSLRHSFAREAEAPTRRPPGNNVRFF